jgi:Sulfotransferase family
MKQWLRDKRLLMDRAAGAAFSVMPPTLYMQMQKRYYELSRSKGELDKIQVLRTVNPTHGRSFLPFDIAKAIFVHVPKCAGDSISLTLFGNFSGSHTTLTEYIYFLDPQRVASYFKFAIVRNPWDRLVSAFHYLKSGGWDEEDRDWFNSELGHFKDFDEFVRVWLNKDNIWKRVYLRPQYHFVIEDHRKIEMDFIGLFENLEEDFRHITNRLGVECTLSQTNKSKHKDYKEYYDDETRKIVANVYDIDIELFGYNFDNSSLPAQLAGRTSAA